MKKLGKVLILSTSIMTGASSLTLTPLEIETVEASSTTKISKTYYQTTDQLNLRSGASTKYKKIMTIPKGKKVTATEKKGSWYKVAYSYTSEEESVTKTGWVSGSYLKEYYQYTSTSKVYYFTKKKTNIYGTPDTKKKQIATITNNNGFYSTQKIINSLGETWYRIPYNGQSSYVKSNNVTKKSFTSFDRTVYEADQDTYLYNSYGHIYENLTQIPQNTLISSTKHIGDWYSVTYEGIQGYIYIDDFTEYTQDITYSFTDTNEDLYVTTTEANLYATADPTTEIMTTVEPNQVFSSTQKAENSLGETWYRISYEKEELYINSNDVKDYEEPAAITSEKITETTFVTNAKQALQQEPSESADLLVELPKESILVATHKTSNGWYQVNYNGQIGYVPITSVKQVTTGNLLAGRNSYQYIDLRTPSPVTAEQINSYIATYIKATNKISVLSEKGQAFIDAGTTYGVNPLYLAAHAIHESAYGTSEIALGKNNLFGFGSYDASPFIASYRFPSIDFNIDYIAKEMKATYLNEISGGFRYQGAYLGFSTKDKNNKRIDADSEGMNFYYASDPGWGAKIAKHMEAILPYDQVYYSKAAVNKTSQSRPTIPDGGDIFPEGILTTATKDLTLNSSKGASDAILILKKGETFTLLEKTNDYWIKISVEDVDYWTKDINFVEYKKYISALNLGRVTENGLNVRVAPTTSAEAIMQLNLNDYVHLVLDENNNIVTDSTKTWYQIQLTDGTIGWVKGSSYIARELR